MKNLRLCVIVDNYLSLQFELSKLFCKFGRKNNVNNMNIQSYFTQRVTVRNYSDKEILDEEIKEMLEAASHAPNTGNMQLYSVVVTRNKELLTKLAPAHFNQPAFTGANVALTFCADINRFEKWCEQRDAQPGFRNLQTLTAALIDASLFAQQFCTVAEMQGLGCCYLGTTTYNASQIAEVLELPNGVVPVTTLSLGYPADKGSDAGRLPIEAIMHADKYKDYTPDDINRLYADKEARDDSKQFVKDNNKTTLAQVFTDVRYTRANNEYFSDAFKSFIKGAGFKI
jgi:nitroreductase